MTDKKTIDEELENLEKEEDKDNDTSSRSEELQKMADALAEEKLKKIKEKLDSAFKTAEAERREKAKLAAEIAELKRKKLEEEGKFEELAKLRLAELEEENKAMKEQLVKATRDRELEKALGGLEFRNEFAKRTAFQTILSELVQEDDGSWVHKSGASLPDYIKVFSKDPEKELLFKPKENTGAGQTTQTARSTSNKRPASLAGLSSEELLRLANEGKLGSWSM